MDLLSFLVSARFYPQPACRCTGYSMTEVLATLTVVGIVVSSGAPAMQSLVHEQRLTTQVNQLFTDLYLTRSEAIKRGVSMVLCKSSDNSRCTPSSTWAQGWVVFVDENENLQVDSGEIVLRVQQGLVNSLALDWRAAFGHNNDIAYRSDGTAFPNGTFTFCDPRGSAYARAIIITTAGRARVSSKSSSDGPLSCS